MRVVDPGVTSSDICVCRASASLQIAGASSASIDIIVFDVN